MAGAVPQFKHHLLQRLHVLTSPICFFLSSYNLAKFGTGLHV